MAEDLDVLSMSFSGTFGAMVLSALQDAYFSDILLLSSTGNQLPNTGFEPQSFTFVMGVGGIGFNGTNQGLDDFEEISGFSIPQTTIPFYAVTTTPPPPPPPLTVSIFGPSMVPPNEFCSYNSSVSGGSGPFTYSWIRNASPAGSGSGVTIFSDVSGYTLKLNVSNSAGQFGTSSMAVTNTAPAPPCFF